MILKCETRLNAIMLTMMPTNQDRISKSQFKKNEHINGGNKVTCPN